MSETQAQYNRLPCKLCGGDLGDSERSVCRVCLGFGIDATPMIQKAVDGCVSGILDINELPRVETADAAGSWRDAVPMCGCQDCGEEFKPWRNGKSLQRTICKPCMIAKRVRKCKETWAEKGGKKTGWKRQAIEPSNQSGVSIISEDSPKLNIVAMLKRRLSDRCLVLDFTDCPWALEWLKEADADPVHAIMQHIISWVDAEWLKEYLIKRLGEARVKENR